MAARSISRTFLMMCESVHHKYDGKRFNKLNDLV
jgi:hypothetical protein